ncbi:MAG: hypothetical protein JWO67_275, partial [Streptosporangiaceae bacterium]|nr:hypothetical protein [Streptosporangiaceae bacterium]
AAAESPLDTAPDARATEAPPPDGWASWAAAPAPTAPQPSGSDADGPSPGASAFGRPQFDDPQFDDPERGDRRFDDSPANRQRFDNPQPGRDGFDPPKRERQAFDAPDRTEFSAPGHGAWEGSLFEGGGDSEPGDSRYAPVMPSGPGTPPKPGTPSSGNLRMPDWMREENGGGPASRLEVDEARGGSRTALFAGVGLLVVALVAAAGVYFLMPRGDAKTAPTPPPVKGGGSATVPQEPAGTPVMPAQRPLKHFPGTPSKVVGKITDVQSGLTYPRFGSPWQLPTKANRLGQLGWSGQQAVVTEHAGSQLWYGQLLSAAMSPAEMSGYGGPGTEQAAAVAVSRSVEARFYGFPHRTLPFASQPLTVDGHKGWLVSSYLRYQRPGIRATGELVVTAVIDTGRRTPAVLFMAVPNTHRKLWADITYVVGNVHVGA